MRNAIIDYMKFKADTSWMIEGDTERASGNFMWKRQSEYGIVQWGHNKSEKRSHVLQGKHLQTWRNDGISDMELLEMIISHGVEFTRIDLAVTVSGDFMQEMVDNVQSFVGALAEQREEKYIANPRMGNVETLYIGSTKTRAKKGLFRAYRYDLAHGLDDILTRYELEIGSNRADSAAKRVNESRDIGATIRGYIDNPSLQSWVDAMGNVVDVPYRGVSAKDELDIKAASREKWLIEQVAPSLGRHMAEHDLHHGNSAFLDQFLKAVDVAYNEKMRENEA